MFRRHLLFHLQGRGSYQSLKLEAICHACTWHWWSYTRLYGVTNQKTKVLVKMNMVSKFSAWSLIYMPEILKCVFQNHVVFWINLAQVKIQWRVAVNKGRKIILLLMWRRISLFGVRMFALSTRPRLKEGM